MLGTPDGARYIREQLFRLASHLKWPTTPLWIETITSYLNDLLPKVSWPLRAGAVYTTRHGEVRIVRGMIHEGCPVYGKAMRDVLPYKITVAEDAGRHRAALALVHELLHAADYRVGVPLNHTLLHNIAAIIESDVLQNMEGYRA